MTKDAAERDTPAASATCARVTRRAAAPVWPRLGLADFFFDFVDTTGLFSGSGAASGRASSMRSGCEWSGASGEASAERLCAVTWLVLSLRNGLRSHPSGGVAAALDAVSPAAISR